MSIEYQLLLPDSIITYMSKFIMAIAVISIYLITLIAIAGVPLPIDKIPWDRL